MRISVKATAAILFFVPLFAGCPNSVTESTKSTGGDSEAIYDYEMLAATIAAERCWSDEYKRGQEIIGRISFATKDSSDSLEISAYRGQYVVLGGSVAPPGGTNDLFSTNGVYLRVVNPAGKDLRPHSVTWTVLVRGKVLQVLQENRIIVVEVKEEDWTVLDTT